MPNSRFLLSLPDDIQNILKPQLETLVLSHGEIMLAAGELIDYIYFPTDSLISMVVTLENGNTVEAATIGNDGFAGIAAFFGGYRAEVTAVVQIPGEALRLDVSVFRKLMENERFREVTGNYAARIFATVAQSAACLAFHPVHERLARWLLLVRDCTEHSEFPLTQDFIAVMLGVHRPTVTIAMRLLESAGLVEHRRGRIRIVDADALTEAACECYRLSGTMRSNARSES
ncbi:MAG TPA: Crp/Fnr family transcriptional regulator [Dehalococcoidia bacterium]|nr:Crp/Fnr family transcriptional regulator [Dehalococcoidia bacterium]